MNNKDAVLKAIKEGLEEAEAMLATVPAITVWDHLPKPTWRTMPLKGDAR